ncbi:unnamed protein product [Lepidochelys olivacea]
MRSQSQIFPGGVWGTRKKHCCSFTRGGEKGGGAQQIEPLLFSQEGLRREASENTASLRVGLFRKERNRVPRCKSWEIKGQQWARREGKIATAHESCPAKRLYGLPSVCNMG